MEHRGAATLSGRTGSALAWHSEGSRGTSVSGGPLRPAVREHQLVGGPLHPAVREHQLVGSLISGKGMQGRLWE